MQETSVVRRFGSLSTEGKTLSPGEVSERVASLKAGIQSKLSHKKDSYTPVFVDYSLESHLFILAMAASGYNFALLDTKTPTPLLEKQLKQLNAKVGISASYSIDGLDNQILSSMVQIEDLYITKPAPDFSEDPEQGSLVVFSSGSTESPKGVIIPWLELDEWVQMRLKGFGADLNHGTRFLNLLPLSWIAGILNLLSVGFGMSLRTLNPLKISPRQLLVEIREADPQQLILSGQLAVLLGKAAESSSDLFLPSLQYIHFGSSLLRWETVSQFKRIVPEDVTLSHVYGATEAVRPFVYKCRISDAPDSGVVPIGVPRDSENVHLRPFGENTFEIVASGNIATGYLDKTLTSEKFSTDENGKTWWFSGDLVSLEEVSGHYYFAGRIDDFIKVNDHNVSLLEVDKALRAHASVSNSSTISVVSEDRNRIVSFIEPNPGLSLDQTQLGGYLRTELPGYSIPHLILTLERLPQTRSGKPDHMKLRELAIAAMTEHRSVKPKRSDYFLPAYRRLLGTCRTSNQILKLHSTLESLATPRQWHTIAQEIFGTTPKWLFWLVTRKTPRSILLKTLPHGRLSTRITLMSRRTFDFLRRNNAVSEYSVAFRKDGMVLFRNPNNIDSSLIVLWNPDTVRRPGMPLWMFLEQTWALNSDILVLRPRKGTRYINGVHGLGANIDECHEGIKEFIVKHNYQKTRSIGVSLGSVPALYCSQNVMIKKTLLAGPIDPERIDPGFWDSMDQLTNSANETAAVLALVGTNASTDMETARSIGKKISLNISHLENANHNVLWRLAARGELTKWLRNNLLND